MQSRPVSRAPTATGEPTRASESGDLKTASSGVPSPFVHIVSFQTRASGNSGTNKHLPTRAVARYFCITRHFSIIFRAGREPRKNKRTCEKCSRAKLMVVGVWIYIFRQRGRTKSDLRSPPSCPTLSNGTQILDVFCERCRSPCCLSPPTPTLKPPLTPAAA